MENNKPIQLTEQDLHVLVEDTVKNILKENGMEEGVWGGLKNVWKGVKQGNLNVGQTYNSGNIASNLQKYAEMAQKGLKGMMTIANQTGNRQILGYLNNVWYALENTVSIFNKTASNVANGRINYNYNQNNGHNIFKINNKTLNKMGYNQQAQMGKNKRPQKQAQQPDIIGAPEENNTSGIIEFP